VGLGIRTALITLLASVTDISTTAPTIASMVGLGRHRLRARSSADTSMAFGRALALRRAGDRSGGSSSSSPATVILAVGLKLASLSTYASFGYSLAVVAVVMAAADARSGAERTGRARLLRAERKAARQPGQAAASKAGRSRIERWAEWVGARPVQAGMVALVVCSPSPRPCSVCTWPQDAGSQPESNTTRQAGSRHDRIRCRRERPAHRGARPDALPSVLVDGVVASLRSGPGSRWCRSP
jgi:RND superfamily putative drug exporter